MNSTPPTPIQNNQKPTILATWSFGLTATNAGWLTLQKQPQQPKDNEANTSAALNAVENACRAVEEDPNVDSVGYGGLPDSAGDVTLDAAIMTAPNHCGAVAAVRRCMYPVSLARKVMEQTHHVMLAGAAADQFAQSQNLNLKRNENLLTDRARAVYEKWKKNDPTLQQDPRMRGWLPSANFEERKGIHGENENDHDSDRPEHEPHNRFHDTVGVLALDQTGQLAAACSTSGMAFKLPGRVGDSPIIGHGLYCEQNIGAAVATGTGELVMGICGSFLAVERLRAGDSPDAAAQLVIQRIISAFTIQPRHQIAILVIDNTGNWSAAALRPGYRTAVMNKGFAEARLTQAQSIAIPDDEASQKPDGNTPSMR